MKAGQVSSRARLEGPRSASATGCCTPLSWTAARRNQLAVSLPAAELGADDVTELQLTVDRTFVPAELVPRSTDRRRLGILVLQASIETAAVHPSQSP